jgi:AraC family transcriptional regulator, L-rhamnose operon transcriptional activator RhaR
MHLAAGGAYGPGMTEPPVDRSGVLLHFTEGTLAYAGHYLHEGDHPVHTHSFFEVAVVTGGQGVHVSPAGRHDITPGDVVLLRPGVWHEYRDCRGLDLYNCCFSAELLLRELAWFREDPLFDHLLWTGPLSLHRRGTLTLRLSAAAMAECAGHLGALDRLRSEPLDRYRGDIIGRLTLFLGCLTRAAGGDPPGGDRTAARHPAVARAMRLMETMPDQRWTLADLAAELHLTRGYLVRRFKAATGLPPMAYLSRLRVETAAALLLHTDESVSRIGEAVGWPDANYFARRFKAHYGMSPTTYRARFRHHAARLRTWE